MPNWVLNEVTIKANTLTLNEIIEKYFSEMDSDEVYLDFNKVVPMPQELDVEAGSSETLSLLAIYYTEKDEDKKEEVYQLIKKFNYFLKDEGIKKRYNDFITKDQDEVNKLIEAGRIYMDNYKKYGHFSWYNWRCDNWGTKWNACDGGHELRNNELFIWFNTAWSCPFPIFEKLHELYPDINIIIRYADEDVFGGNCGQFEYKDGEIIYSDEDAEEIGKELWWY